MMASPSLWGLYLSNGLLFVLGGVLMVLSLLAYRREQHRTFVWAILGFGLISVGSVIELVYQLWIKSPYYLSGMELIQLQAIEKLVIAAGLFMLIYSLVRH